SGAPAVEAAGSCVTNVTASAPLASSGGTTPNVSFTGVLPVANGGTNISTLVGSKCIRSASTTAFAEAVADCVTNVTGSGNIASSGGTTPNITFTGVLTAANGGTGQSSLPLTIANGGTGASSLAGANIAVTNANNNFSAAQTIATSATAGTLQLGGVTQNCPFDFGVTFTDELTIPCNIIASLSGTASPALTIGQNNTNEWAFKIYGANGLGTYTAVGANAAGASVSGVTPTAMYVDAETTGIAALDRSGDIGVAGNVEAGGTTEARGGTAHVITGGACGIAGVVQLCSSNAASYLVPSAAGNPITFSNAAFTIQNAQIPDTGGFLIHPGSASSTLATVLSVNGVTETRYQWQAYTPSCTTNAGGHCTATFSVTNGYLFCSAPMGKSTDYVSGETLTLETQVTPTQIAVNIDNGGNAVTHTVNVECVAY
ncbi:MAG: hypothetical protein KGL39_32620, partial [Patescibacteria group bacterium]|nr:hypothetical protein [Patescibacteria group bacterium]